MRVIRSTPSVSSRNTNAYHAVACASDAMRERVCPSQTRKRPSPGYLLPTVVDVDLTWYFVALLGCLRSHQSGSSDRPSKPYTSATISSATSPNDFDRCSRSCRVRGSDRISRTSVTRHHRQPPPRSVLSLLAVALTASPAKRFPAGRAPHRR